MAESSIAQYEDRNHECPICLEKLNSPRSIPICKHSFCENCLFTFVLNLKQKGKIDSSFECPVCRLPCEMSESGEVTMEWIQTFPLSEGLMADDVRHPEIEICKKSDDDNKMCGPCLDEGITASGKKYCLDCHGYLCEECVTAHKKWKALKKHKLLTKETIDVIAVFEEVQKRIKCVKHPAYDVELYCDSHKELMCLMCSAISHKECKNILDIDSADITEKRAADLKLRMESADARLFSIKQISESNYGDLKKEVKSYQEELNEMKGNIVKRLNDIADIECSNTKQILKDVEDKTFTYTQKIENLRDLYRKKMNFLQTIVQNGRSREIFVCVESLVADIETLEKQICQTESNLKTAVVDSKITDNLKRVSHLLSEGQIVPLLVTYNSPESLERFKYDFENCVVNTFPIEKKIYTHRRRHHNVVQLYEFTSIYIYNEDTILLCENGENPHITGLYIYDQNKTTHKRIELHFPHCVTQLTDRTIAVTTGKNNNTIYCMSLDRSENHFVRNVKVKNSPRGIVALDTGNVAISWHVNGTIILNFNCWNDPHAFSISDISGPEIHHVDYFTEDSTGRKFKTFDHLAINEKKQYVIQPCTVDKAVYCFTFKQQPVFKYENNLKCPRGVAVDPKSGCVFVCDYSDNCIHQVSISGKPVSVIRHETLTKPLSVYFNGDRTCLWVTGSHDMGQISCVIPTEK